MKWTTISFAALAVGLAAGCTEKSPEEKLEDNTVQLTNTKTFEWEPAFSPDQSRIVYASAREGDWDLYLRNGDGSNEQRLTSDPAEDREPSFSPEGMTIVFASNRDGNFEIYTMPVTGGEPPPQYLLHGCRRHKREPDYGFRGGLLQSDLER